MILCDGVDQHSEQLRPKGDDGPTGSRDSRAEDDGLCSNRSFRRGGAGRTRLAPTELIIFGNVRGGTPLIQSVHTVGIDLPLKALVWEDAAGKTWLSYNEPSWIARRHNVRNAEQLVSKMAAELRSISTKAANGP